MLVIFFWTTILLCRCISASQQSLGVKPLPVVIWHGLGDTYDSAGIHRAVETIKKAQDDVFVHVVYLDENPSEDRSQSLFGNANEQLARVCTQLANITELNGGFNGVGFSQGGLFLRAYAEVCNDPPLKTLITFGSPHNGIADLPACGPRDFICRRRNQLLKSRVWGDYAQSSIISAQYFRDPEDIESYLLHSGFLANVNNERLESQNSTFKANLKSLNQLVLILFSEDETVIPKESAVSISIKCYGIVVLI